MIFSRAKKNDAPTRRRGVTEPSPSGIEATSSQFRRNRTLSGVKRSVDAASPRSQVHHLARQRQKVGGLFLIIIAAIVLLAILITQLTARVVVTGSSQALVTSIKGAEYEKVIDEYYGLHPASRLRFILDESDLSQYVASVTPEVVRVEQSGVENIVDTHFTITFRRPVAGWQINGRQYYVDDQGVVFQKNYYETPTVQIIDESGVSPEQGSTVASARLLSFVGRVVALSKDSSYEVTQAILPVGTTRQLEIRLKDVVPLVKLSIDRGAGEQTEDMVRALQYLKSKGWSPGYVDVRVSGRAAYQ